MAMHRLPVSGGYFKPADHMGSIVYIVPTALALQQPNPPYVPRDVLTAKVVVFADVDAVNADSGTDLGSVSITSILLVRDLANLVGKGATAARLRQLPPKPGKQAAWVWAQLDEVEFAAVEQYEQRRDAAVAAAVEDMPEF